MLRSSTALAWIRQRYGPLKPGDYIIRIAQHSKVVDEAAFRVLPSEESSSSNRPFSGRNHHLLAQGRWLILTPRRFFPGFAHTTSHPRGSTSLLKKAAVTILLRRSSEGPAGLDILFIERAAHDRDPWSGHMAFPGGRVDPGDASPLAAAVRETMEEIGVVLDPANLIASVREIQASAKGSFLSMIVYPFVS